MRARTTRRRGLYGLRLFKALQTHSDGNIVMALAAIIWIVGQALGGIFTGQATDPNSGPLLVLLNLAYWPLKPRQASPDTGSEPASQS